MAEKTKLPSDGVVDLPPEIWNLVFDEFVRDDRWRYNPIEAPCVLAHVCRSWMDTVVSTPALWAWIRVDLLDNRQAQRRQKCRVEHSLERTQGSALHVIIGDKHSDPDGDFCKEEKRFIKSFFATSARWISLDFGPTFAFDEPHRFLYDEMHRLRGQLGRLKTLKIASPEDEHLSAFDILPELTQLTCHKIPCISVCSELQVITTTDLMDLSCILLKVPKLTRAIMAISSRSFPTGYIALTNERLRSLVLPDYVLHRVDLHFYLPQLTEISFTRRPGDSYRGPNTRTQLQCGLDRVAVLASKCQLRSISLTLATRFKATVFNPSFFNMLSTQLSRLTRLQLSEAVDHTSEEEDLHISYIDSWRGSLLPELLDLDYTLFNSQAQFPVYDLISGYVRNRCSGRNDNSCAKLKKFTMRLNCNTSFKCNLSTRRMYPPSFIDAMKQLKREGLDVTVLGYSVSDFEVPVDLDQ